MRLFYEDNEDKLDESLPSALSKSNLTLLFNFWSPFGAEDDDLLKSERRAIAMIGMSMSDFSLLVLESVLLLSVYTLSIDSVWLDLDGSA